MNVDRTLGAWTGEVRYVPVNEMEVLAIEAGISLAALGPCVKMQGPFAAVSLLPELYLGLMMACLACVFVPQLCYIQEEVEANVVRPLTWKHL